MIDGLTDRPTDCSVTAML